MELRDDEGGQRVTSGCGCYSTYMDDGRLGEMLCCKQCYRAVENGEGDGSEFAPGIDIDLYYKNVFAQHEREQEQQAFLRSM